MLTASFFSLELGSFTDFPADVKRIRKHAYGASDDDGVRPLEPGIDHRGSSGRADLDVTANQSSGYRLPAGELDDFQVLDSMLLEEAPFLCRPKRRLSRAENRSHSQRLLGEEPRWTEDKKNPANETNFLRQLH